MQESATKSWAFSNELEIKSEGRNFWVEGIISTTNPDLGNDIITEQCLERMASTINHKRVKLTCEHQEIMGGAFDAIPIGQLVEAKLENGALFVKGTLNSDLKVFPELRSALERKDIDAFSIEYLAKDTTEIQQDGKTFRQISDLDLVGVTLTGRPMNQDSFLMFQAKKLKPTEVKEMSEEEVKEEVKEEVAEEEAPAEEAEAEEEAEEEPEAEEKSVKKITETKSIPANEYAEFRKYTDAKEAETKHAEVKSVVLDAIEKKYPQLNGEPKFEGKAIPELKTWEKTVYETDEKGIPTYDTELMWKSAADLHNALIPHGIENRRQHFGPSVPGSRQNFTVAGKASQFVNIEKKAWDDGSGALEHDTSKNADTDYYQNAAELRDIYDPIIAVQLNDQTTTYGRLPKKDVSGFADRYGWVAVYGRNSTAQAYDEGDITTSSVADRADRVKLQQPFMSYGIIVEVTGKMIADARGGGGIGDIFAAEVQRATIDLLKLLNQDIHSATASVGFADGGKILNFEGVTDDTNNTTIYGITRGSGVGIGLASAVDTSESGTPNVSKAKLRADITAVLKNGAMKKNLVFFTSYEQEDKIKGLLDPAQRFMSTSGKAGYEGLIEFDGIPIFPDADCQAGFIFLIDVSETFIALQVAPTMELLAQTGDHKRALIKTYLNLVCRKPLQTAVRYGLNTS